MPILLPPADGRPLSQGDLLAGLDVFRTELTGHPGKASGHCLVVSRPCAAVNKENVLVALIERFSLNLPKNLGQEAKSLAGLVRLFREVRDADGSDAMYLGELPGGDGTRHAARLDFIATIAVPTSSSERATWIAERRIASLGIEFRRDLHTRLFLAFAKQGFDDTTWFSDRDLEVIINFGQTKLAEAEQAVRDAGLEIERAAADGNYSGRRQTSLDSKSADASAGADEARTELQEYLNERDRRAAGLPE